MDRFKTLLSRPPAGLRAAPSADALQIRTRYAPAPWSRREVFGDLTLSGGLIALVAFAGWVAMLLVMLSFVDPRREILFGFALVSWGTLFPFCFVAIGACLELTRPLEIQIGANRLQIGSQQWFLHEIEAVRLSLHAVDASGARVFEPVLVVEADRRKLRRRLACTEAQARWLGEVLDEAVRQSRARSEEAVPRALQPLREHER